MIRYLLLVCLFVGYAQISYAGNTDGGGAGALICRSGNKLYDLWEAGVPRLLSKSGLRISYSKAAVDLQVEKAIVRLEQANPSFGERLRWEVDFFYKHRAGMPSGTKISPPKDLDSVLVDSNCKEIAGLARWLDEKNIVYVDEALFKSLKTNTDRAALIVHEAIYRVLREQDHAHSLNSSFPARLIVAYLFSDIVPTQFPFVANKVVVAPVCAGCLTEIEISGIFPQWPAFTFEATNVTGDTRCQGAEIHVFRREESKNSEIDVSKGLEVSPNAAFEGGFFYSIKRPASDCNIAATIRDNSGRIVMNYSGVAGSEDKEYQAALYFKYLSIEETALAMSRFY